MTTLRMGTRASRLALAQSGAFAARLTEVTGVDVEVAPVSTEGDRTRTPLVEAGGGGVVGAEVREGLPSGEVGFPEHSRQDIPW